MQRTFRWGEIEVKVGKEGVFQDDNEREERKAVVTVTLLMLAKGRK